MNAPIIGLIGAIVVPAVVIVFAVLVTRNPVWAWGSRVRRRRVFLGLGALYAVIGLLWVVGSDQAVWGWIYLAMGAGSILVAWWEGRKVSPT
jgi:multisubunit Na+/H+ antiporter MnhB subunit